MLVETKQYDRAIRTIHSTARWLHGRSNETFWEFFQDSREWDEDDSRREQVEGYIPHQHHPHQYTLPIEIRVGLGLSWLQLNNPDEAIVLQFEKTANEIQFRFLGKEDVSRYPEMFSEVARELQSAQIHSQALIFLSALECLDDVSLIRSRLKIGR